MFCEGNEDVLPPFKAPFVRRRVSGRWKEGRGWLGGQGLLEVHMGSGTIILVEMHINISLMERLEPLLWYSNNTLLGAHSTNTEQTL